MKTLEHLFFSEQAERTSALYNEEEDALLLAMLGQEYVIRHDGVYLHGQHAPEVQTAVVRDYLFSSGTSLVLAPWRTISDFSPHVSPDFRKRVELPIISYATEIISRANIILPMIDAKTVPSLVGSDMAFIIRALPKVSLHLELSQENQDFPAEAWVRYSNNAKEFLSVPSMQVLAELFKDRLLSVLRIY